MEQREVSKIIPIERARKRKKRHPERCNHDPGCYAHSFYLDCKELRLFGLDHHERCLTLNAPLMKLTFAIEDTKTLLREIRAEAGTGRKATKIRELADQAEAELAKAVALEGPVCALFDAGVRWRRTAEDVALVLLDHTQGRCTRADYLPEA
ncbi:MAG: hypothetical protein ACRERD_12255 [Candidatus Binatia bacterium]